MLCQPDVYLQKARIAVVVVEFVSVKASKM
jgi:hypothetical protein